MVTNRALYATRTECGIERLARTAGRLGARALDLAADSLPILCTVGFLLLAWANILGAFGVRAVEAWAWGGGCTLLATLFIGLFWAGRRDGEEG